jgi:hypothetical protein
MAGDSCVERMRACQQRGFPLKSFKSLVGFATVLACSIAAAQSYTVHPVASEACTAQGCAHLRHNVHGRR